MLEKKILKCLYIDRANLLKISVSSTGFSIKFVFSSRIGMLKENILKLYEIDEEIK